MPRPRNSWLGSCRHVATVHDERDGLRWWRPTSFDGLGDAKVRSKPDIRADLTASNVGLSPKLLRKRFVTPKPRRSFHRRCTHLTAKCSWTPICPDYALTARAKSWAQT